MTRRFRFLLPALSLAMLASACGDGTDVAVDTPSSSEGSVEPTEATPSPTEDDAPTESDGADEGEGRAEDAMFGVEVCEALIPVVLGEATDGPARPFVLAELAPVPDYTPEPEDVSAWQDEDTDAPYDTCNVSAGGDGWYEIALTGDGHVGHHGVGVVLRTSYDTPQDVDLAVEDATLAGDLCDGQEPQGHEVLDVLGNHVVAVQCDFFAYQGIYEFWFWPGYELRAMDVETWFEGEVTQADAILGFPTTDGFGGVESLEKARGIGDCGTFSSWFVADDLSLDLGFATHRDCDDSDGTADPYSWDLVYEAP